MNRDFCPEDEMTIDCGVTAKSRDLETRVIGWKEEKTFHFGRSSEIKLPNPINRSNIIKSIFPSTMSRARVKMPSRISTGNTIPMNKVMLTFFARVDNHGFDGATFNDYTIYDRAQKLA